MIRSYPRLVRIANPISWDHHRGGWTYVTNAMLEHLHAEDGTLLVTAIEDELLYGGPLRDKWIGFVHQVPRHRMNFPDLERLVTSPSWNASIKRCAGLFVLTDYQRRFLKKWGVSVPICRLTYPLAPFNRRFELAAFKSLPPRLIMVGEFLRNYQTFFDLKSEPFRKILLAHPGFDPKKRAIRTNSTVEISERVSVESYDNLLAEAVVFLDLFDAVAVTTMIECIGRCTPLLIRRVGAVEEYLGSDYPLYFSSLEEAETKLANNELIVEAHHHLKNNPIQKLLTIDAFLDSLTQSAIYRSLPEPPSQQISFQSKDVSVLICNYARTYNLRHILQGFFEQQGTFRLEVFIWNNSPEVREEVDEIVKDFVTPSFPVRVFHSSDNYFCAMRFGIGQFMRGKILIICDDDVIPGPNYVNEFLAAYKRLGPDVALCARGHVIHPHSIDEEAPAQVWVTHDETALSFFDQYDEERQVHFMHADSCLIPKHLLMRVIGYEPPRLSTLLVDDYWMSFVLSHYMHVPIWKIKMDKHMVVTPCADDPKIAMFHRDDVANERVSFYVYHMRLGWPNESEAREINWNAP